MQKKNVWALVGLVAVVLLIAAAVNNNPNANTDLAGGGKPSATVYCSDSDGGVNISLQGTARTYKIAKNGSQTTLSSSTDSCANALSVTEYSCNGSYLTSSVVPCSGSCSNGACVSGGSTGSDTTPPTVSVKVPEEGRVYCTSANNYFGALAGDNNFPFPATGVTFYMDGALYSPQPTVFYAPNEYGMSIPAGGAGPGWTAGNHSMYVRACDAAGNCTNSGTNNFSITSQCTS